MDSSGTYVHWNPTFLRAVQDWKLEFFVAFIDLLYRLKTHPRETNKMLWSPASNYRFGVKSYYYTLQSGEFSLFLWKSTWKVKAPPCFAFFTWTATLGNILMIDNLRRWGSYPCQLVLSLQKERGDRKPLSHSL
jgi:hypothetical protein